MAHSIVLLLSVKSLINITSEGTEIPETYKYFTNVAEWSDEVSSFCHGRRALQQGVQGGFLDQGNLTAAERATMAEGTWAGPGEMSGTHTLPLP